MRLAALRGAIAGEVTGSDGLGAVRSALKRVFKKITLVRTPEDELVLVPEVCAFEEVDAWVRLPDGRCNQAEAANTGPASKTKGQRTLVL